MINMRKRTPVVILATVTLAMMIDPIAIIK